MHGNDNGIIVATKGATVKGNTLRGNQTAGIDVAGTDNVIEENFVSSSGTGILFEQTGNFYANNRAADCTTAYGGSVPSGAGDGGGNKSF